MSLAREILEKINAGQVVKVTEGYTLPEGLEEVRFEVVAEGFANAIEEMANPAMVSDKDIIRLDKDIFTKRKEKEKLIEDLLAIYQRYEKPLSTVRSKFETIVKKSISKFKGVKFLADTKTPKSIINKAIERNKGLMNINDLVRGAVLFETKADADKFVKDLIRKFKTLIAGYEEKQRGKDATYGYYGSHHLDLNIDGIIVELQIMTKKLWQYKHAAHDIYDRTRSKPNGPDGFDRHMSKKIFTLGNRKSESLTFNVAELESLTDAVWEEVDLES